MAAADHVVADLDFGSASTSGGRVTTLPDNEGGSSATDPVGSNGPTLTTSNGTTIAVFDASQHLSWPIQASINGRTGTQGFAYWFRPHTVTPSSGFQETLTTWNTTGSASGTRFNITQHNAALELYGGPADPTFVRSVASFFSANVWVFLYVHFDGSQTGEARLKVFSVDANGQVTSHSTSADVGTIGTTLPSVTGNTLIGAYNSSDTDSVDGNYGQHIYALDDLLTNQEILELAAIDAPVVLGYATGAASTAAVTASGTASAVNERDASGTPSTAATTASGAAVHLSSASGTPSTAAATASGTAARVANASGTPSTAAATATGAAEVPVNASGTPSTAAVTATGLAFGQGSVGVAETAAVTASGAAILDREASGTPSTGAATAAGTAYLPPNASGTPSTGVTTATGAAEVLVQASGTPSTAAATASGAVTLSRAAAAAATTASVTASGSADIDLPVSATLTPRIVERVKALTVITQPSVAIVRTTGG